MGAPNRFNHLFTSQVPHLHACSLQHVRLLRLLPVSALFISNSGCAGSCQCQSNCKSLISPRGSSFAAGCGELYVSLRSAFVGQVEGGQQFHGHPPGGASDTCIIRLWLALSPSNASPASRCQPLAPSSRFQRNCSGCGAVGPPLAHRRTDTIPRSIREEAGKRASHA